MVTGMAVKRIELEPGKRIDTRMCVCGAVQARSFTMQSVLSRCYLCVCARGWFASGK